MSKDLHLIQLFGTYGKLLTEHQKDLFNLYYECDLSLGEIADIKGISRQSVNDAIKKAKEVLLQTEDDLGLYKKISALKAAVYEAEDGSPATAELVQRLKQILEDE